MNSVHGVGYWARQTTVPSRSANTMFGAGRTVISLPARELAGLSVPGSLIEPSQFYELPVSSNLKDAFALVEPHVKRPVFLVRSEIFTHGATREWLDKRLGVVSDHLALSDGTSIKLLSGMENHAFVYGTCWQSGWNGLWNLSKWAPEIFGTLRSQINTFIGGKVGGKRVRPATQLLFRGQPSTLAAKPNYYGYFMNRYSPEESAKRIVDSGVIESPTFERFSSLQYIPLTDSGMVGRSFSRMLARSILAAYLNPTSGLLIRLPELDTPKADKADTEKRITDALAAIRSSGIVLPKYPSQNVIFTDQDIEPKLLAARDNDVSLTIDETFDFWRHSRAFYDNLPVIRFYTESKLPERRRAAMESAATLFGRKPQAKPGYFELSRLAVALAV